VSKQPEDQAFFDFADRNGDGRLETAEIVAGLKALSLLAACEIAMSVTDHGTGVFELLDRNGDGQLTPRELADAVNTLQPFADAQGAVHPSALPRRLTVRVTTASMPAVISFPQPETVAATAPAAKPPEWFWRMDRNGDGEISEREFLGPLELFDKFDRNRDGLISPKEIERE
jgi:Ca2+-binding EF-hand superfamily protein